jgi:putative MFS transporter
VAALGYFVDVYDLVLFGVIRVPSLIGIGITSDADIAHYGKMLFNYQMWGMLAGGVFWGVLGDKKGQAFRFIRFHFFIFYCQYFKWHDYNNRAI